MGIEKEFLLERRDQDHFRPHPAAQTIQSRESRGTILVGAGESFLESVIAGEDHGGAGELLVVLSDELLEDARPTPQACFDLGQSVLAIGVADDEVGRALEEGQKADQKNDEPAAEAAESKFQR